MSLKKCTVEDCGSRSTKQEGVERPSRNVLSEFRELVLLVPVDYYRYIRVPAGARAGPSRFLIW